MLLTPRRDGRKLGCAVPACMPLDEERISLGAKTLLARRPVITRPYVADVSPVPSRRSVIQQSEDTAGGLHRYPVRGLLVPAGSPARAPTHALGSP